MKKMIVLAVLLISQMVFAAPGQPTARRLTPAQAREAVQNSPTYKMIEQMRREGKDITSDPAMMRRVNSVLDVNLRNVVTLNAASRANLIKLLNISTLDVMSEVARLSSIAKDPSSTAQQKQMAAKGLELMAKAGHTVNGLVRNSAEAQRQQAAIKEIIEVSNKISALDFGAASKSFVEKYERALTEGKTVEEAVRIASNGKFTKKELRECE
jgi:hypothetical protein